MGGRGHGEGCRKHRPQIVANPGSHSQTLHLWTRPACSLKAFPQLENGNKVFFLAGILRWSLSVVGNRRCFLSGSSRAWQLLYGALSHSSKNALVMFTRHVSGEKISPASHTEVPGANQVARVSAPSARSMWSHTAQVSTWYLSISVVEDQAEIELSGF